MAEERVQRRLAAILAADVVGYSRLMGEDEAGTLAALNTHRAEFIHPTVAKYKGRIVKLMGDGALVEFPSVVDAVDCSVAVQRGMEERNADIPDSKQITFRIGINLGDIIIDGEDIYGDGVNIAARLEGLAEPGGICVSEKVFEEIGNKLDTGFEDLGPQEVKNIAKPVRAYAVDRATVRQKKTGRPVKFEITEPTRNAIDDYLNTLSKAPGDFLFSGRSNKIPCLSTRQYARLVSEWISGIGLDPCLFGTHSLRRTKATLIYRQTGNLRAVQLLLGHTKLESTVRYLGVEVDDALAIAEQVDV